MRFLIAERWTKETGTPTSSLHTILPGSLLNGSCVKYYRAFFPMVMK